jgi:hypothetical protein
VVDRAVDRDRGVLHTVAGERVDQDHLMTADGRRRPVRGRQGRTRRPGACRPAGAACRPGVRVPWPPGRSIAFSATGEPPGAGAGWIGAVRPKIGLGTGAARGRGCRFGRWEGPVTGGPPLWPQRGGNADPPPFPSCPRPAAPAPARRPLPPSSNLAIRIRTRHRRAPGFVSAAGERQWQR